MYEGGEMAFKYYHKHEADGVTVRVYAGTGEDKFTECGVLKFTEKQWEEFRKFVLGIPPPLEVCQAITLEQRW